MHPRSPLTPRENEIALAFAKGANYKQIARDLSVAPTTIRAHLRSVYQKLGVSTKVALSQALHDRMHPEKKGESDVPGEDDPSEALLEPEKSTRLAVRKFTIDGDSAADIALATGITEDIVSELSRFHRLTVFPMSASERFFDEFDMGAGPTIGCVHFAIDGSIRRQGDTIRVAVHLIDLEDAGQVWADKFDAEADNLFAIQDEIAVRIAGTVFGRTEEVRAIRARRRPPNSLAAYECVLKGKYLEVGDPISEKEARELFERAIELDPDYALAHSKLAQLTMLQWDRNLDADPGLSDRALELARRGAALDNSDPYAQYVLGFVHLFRKSYDLTEEYIARAMKLSRNDAELVALIGLLQAFLGQGAQALSHLERARFLNPYFEPSWSWNAAGLAHFVAGNYREAVLAFERSVNQPVWVCVYLAACEALEGNATSAARYRDQVLEQNPDFAVTKFVEREPLARATDKAKLKQGLVMAGAR
ncbi:MAG: LuxR C-terminal-related transcriptional regulator [Pseudomonadota bacterium]